MNGPIPQLHSRSKGDTQKKQTLDMDAKLAEEMEIKKRNWWVIDGKAYDLTDFLKSHPGGASALMLCKGLDCTELFRTYHLMRTPPAALMEKYEVPLPPNFKFPPSQYSFEKGDFLDTVRSRVREHFEKEKKSIKGSMLFQIASYSLILVVALLNYPILVYGSLVAALFQSVLKGYVAVTAGHTASHFSLFPWIEMNSIMFRYCSPIVLSAHQIWSTSHIVSHHIHTLTHDDLQDNYPVKRVQPSLPFLWFHKFQHMYICFIYLLGLPLWTLSDFFDTIVGLHSGKLHFRHLPLSMRIENCVAIGLNVLINIAAPFIFLPFERALPVFLCSNVPSSLMLVLQIAVNHEVPETASADIKKNKLDWGVHQVLTSHNFGVNSSFALHMSGGLNLQIEHHLMPSIHFSHFPEIAPIVKRTCEEFGLPYNTSSNLLEAVSKHYKLLKMNSSP